MTSSLASIIQDALALLVLGIILGFVGLLLLKEHAKLLRINPRATMSAEVIFMLITHAGAPGYLAAFLLSSAILSGASAFLMLAINLASYFGLFVFS